MFRTSIVYFSQGGSTALIAESIAEGVKSMPGAEVELLRVTGSQIINGRWEDTGFLDRITIADSVIFGAPTFMGGVAAQFKAFADATAGLWAKKTWNDKVAGGFTISASPSGDKLNTLAYFHILAAQHGMIWVNWDELPRQPDGTNRLGASIGFMAQNPTLPGQPIQLEAADIVSARKYGRRIAAVAARFSARAE